MKTIRVVDTNVILRYLLADHPEHFARASEFMAGLKSGNQTAYIPESEQKGGTDYPTRGG